MKTERRAFQFEFRAEGDAPKITGHAALFNTDAEIGGRFTERILPGAFSDSIATGDVRALYNHNPDMVLGRNKANTLRLVEDERGLSVEIDLPDTQVARDLTTSIKRGDVSGMSFGFMVPTGGAAWTEESGKTIRTLKRVNLLDVSPVTFPAYIETDVSVRSATEILAERLQPQVYDWTAMKRYLEALAAK
jgi:HK97 family phage prohead protease